MEKEDTFCKQVCGTKKLLAVISSFTRALYTVLHFITQADMDGWQDLGKTNFYVHHTYKVWKQLNAELHVTDTVQYH
jgi:hypothetical protein